MKNRGDKILSDTDSSDYLLLLHGKKIRNLEELADSMKNMPEAIFGYHVNFHKNDFSEWIKSSLNDKKLASGVSRAKTKEKMLEIINKRIHEIKPNKKTQLKNKNETKKIENKGKDIKKSFHKASKANNGLTKQNRENKIKIEKPLENTINIESLKALNEVLEREKTIFEKEREIDVRERKIQETEERIEERLNNALAKENQKNRLFSKDFFQGILVGLLLAAITVIIYWKFFIQ